MINAQNNIGVFTTDTNLLIRTWDAWIANATNISAETACGQSLTELFPNLSSAILTRFQHVLSEGVVEVLAPAFHHYLFHCAPQLPTRHFNTMQQYVTITPLRDNDQIVGTLVTVEDVTARLARERDLAEDLDSLDEHTRLQAVQALAAESMEPIPLLMHTLDDRSWRVRHAAVHSLAQFPDAHVIATIVRMLRDDHHNPNVLNSTLQVLGLLGSDVIAPLIELLNLPDTDLRIYVVLALGAQRDPRVIPVLLHALHDPDINVRYHAIEALGNLRAVDALEALVAVAESRDFFLAFPALMALTRIGEAQIVTRIVPLLDDALLAEPAAMVLGQLGTLETIAPLSIALNKPIAPTSVIAQAIAAIYDRYTATYHEGGVIAEQVRQTLNATGTQRLLNTLPNAGPADLRALTLVLSWSEGPAVHDALVRLMAQPLVRGEVIESLVRHGTHVVELLIEQLTAEDFELRLAAIDVLGRIGSSASVPALIGLLDGQSDVAMLAAGALAKIGDQRAFEPLLQLLGSSHAAIRRASIGALNSLGNPTMAERIALLLHDPDPCVRESAVKIAGYFGYENCLDSIIACCTDPDEQVQCAAIEQLAYIDHPQALETLIHTLRHSDQLAQRRAAARTCSYVDTPHTLASVRAALYDTDPWVRYYAVRALGRQRYTEALGDLIDCAQFDPARHVQITAIEALGQFGDVQALPVLATLTNNNDDLAQAAIAALGQINHPDSQAQLFALIDSPQPTRRIAAISALGQPQAKIHVVETLHATAADTDPHMRVAAIKALAQIATADAISALINLAINPTLHDEISTALAQLGEQHIASIAQGLHHAHIEVRGMVIATLARMKHPHASEYLLIALHDPEPAVRLAATLAFGHLGSRIAHQELTKMAWADTDPVIRQAAHAALR